jgi:allantoinase
MATTLVIRGRRVATAEGIRPASVHIGDTSITAVAAFDALPAGAALYDAGEALVMPGVVDTHVHVNQPGRTEWEGFESATDAAAAGGTTTLVDMPLNSIPATTTAAALAVKRDSARGHCRIDVGFWGGVVPGNAPELRPMAAGGALGFKCFLVESGVDEFQFVREADLRPAMRELASLGRPLLVHAEVAEPIEAAAAALRAEGADPRRYQTYLRSRPRAAEDEAIALLIRLVRETRARSHVVHHSSADALELLRSARGQGLPLSAETCPHYLHFAAEDIPDGRTEFKCAPPIRERANREALWAALDQGVLDLVASDHSPCSPALKKLEQGDFEQAWGGVAGLQLALSVTWTGAHKRGFGIERVIGWMCEAPARLAGLQDKKGRLTPGSDADITIFRDGESFTVEPSRLLHRHKISPYAGNELRGVVEATFSRGRMVFERGELRGGRSGRLLTASDPTSAR